MSRKLQVTAELSPKTSVQEVSKVFEGLTQLERNDEIHFNIAPSRCSRHPRVIRFNIAAGIEITRTAVIDVADQSDFFSFEELEEVDVYFKRSFQASAVAALPLLLQRKVQPFGLSNPAISHQSAASLLLARMRTGRRPLELLRDAQQLFALPSPRSFESPPDSDAELLVLFQTRVWSPLRDETFTEVNEERVRLIRELRKALGSRFIGGLVPDPFAREHYPDVITRLPFSMRAYPRLVKRALVGVYTTGLHNSVAFKLSEYLAASRCIVAQKPLATLPMALESGRHYLDFSSPDQCIANCETILSRPSLARDMRVANWDYYQVQVEPSAHLRNILVRSTLSTFAQRL